MLHVLLTSSVKLLGYFEISIKYVYYVGIRRYTVMKFVFSDHIHRLHHHIRRVHLSTARRVQSTVRKGTTVQRVPVTRRALRLSARNLQVRSSLSRFRFVFSVHLLLLTLFWKNIYIDINRLFRQAKSICLAVTTVLSIWSDFIFFNRIQPELTDLFSHFTGVQVIYFLKTLSFFGITLSRQGKTAAFKLILAARDISVIYQFFSHKWVRKFLLLHNNCT